MANYFISFTDTDLIYEIENNPFAEFRTAARYELNRRRKEAGKHE